MIVGNADCRVLTYGSREEIRAEVERCARLGRECPGYFFAVGNHIPVEVPLDNLLYYFDLCRELGLGSGSAATVLRARSSATFQLSGPS